MSDVERLGLLRELEDLTRAVGAVSMGVQVAFQASQVLAQAAAGVPASRRGKAVADELATARKTSPYWASRDLTAARALVLEMPCTHAALADGVINVLQARLLTEATVCLSVPDRAEVDARLVDALPGASTKAMVAAARALTYEVDPAGYVARARRAAADRGVSVRPAPDVMGILSARLPAAQAIACHQALRVHAQALRAAGDPRSVAQLMADELFARLTGRAVVDGIDIEVGLVITDAALFAGDSTAADLTGYGPIPADLARDLLHPRNHDHDHGHTGHAEQAEHTARTEPGSARGPDPCDHERDTGPEQEPAGEVEQACYCPAGGMCTSPACTLTHNGVVIGPPPPTFARQTPTPECVNDTRDGDSRAHHADSTNTAGRAEDLDGVVRAARVWLRRLYADPLTGTLTVRDPRRRAFTGNLRATLIARGRYCANPWCGAPIRHADHVHRYAQDGPTTETNGRGLCARCNHAREHPRTSDPPPQAYLRPPPILDGFHGRPPAGAPPPRLHPANATHDQHLPETA